jgi:hypothetical protein
MADEVPRVTMKELTRPIVTMRPLITPTATPVTTPTPMASSNGTPLTAASAHVRPARLIVDPTERSRLPEIMMKVAPIPATPTTATASRMLSRFWGDRNTGLPMAMSAPRMTMTASAMSSEPQVRARVRRRVGG